MDSNSPPHTWHALQRHDAQWRGVQSQSHVERHGGGDGASQRERMQPVPALQK